MSICSLIVVPHTRTLISPHTPDEAFVESRFSGDSLSPLPLFENMPGTQDTSFQDLVRLERNFNNPWCLFFLPQIHIHLIFVDNFIVACISWPGTIPKTRRIGPQ